ncbi:hypothetical protein ACFXKK_36305 [Streptomyces globisporus]|uniref:DinB/UmuC family translesion DNA polymerase n=1 Tax=Streptomyces globisporus TaxID=1908 RepID=UPI0036682545
MGTGAPRRPRRRAQVDEREPPLRPRRTRPRPAPPGGPRPGPRPRRRLRTSGEIAQALTLTVTYADRTQTTRTRSLTEPTAHTPALATTARDLLTGLGLQRARVCALALRAERLCPAEDTVHQLTLNARDDNLRRLEAAGPQQGRGPLRCRRRRSRVDLPPSRVGGAGRWLQPNGILRSTG